MKLKRFCAGLFLLSSFGMASNCSDTTSDEGASHGKKAITELSGEPQPASKATIALHKKALANLPSDKAQDEDFATRGFIATWPTYEISKFGGGVSVDLSGNDFIEGEAPYTVNPALWHHGKIMSHEGLFKVTDGIYQVRGFDVCNITFIETDNGYIVVDPLTAAEPAKAAYDLMKEHVGDKPVLAVLYTHPHSDHFAGIEGVIDPEDVATGKVEIIAPEGFMEEAVSEWMIAGNAMGRRAFYQFGLFLESGEKGHVGMGMGPFIALGKHLLVPPTLDITHTGQVVTIDGLDIVFQLTPGAEAPVEFNFFIPEYEALCMAETATASIHNVQTLRGASVRDAGAWAGYLTEADQLFGANAEVLFVSHHWPRFGNDEIRDYLKKHRDTYKFLHDQTVRMMNAGLTPTEIAEDLKLPPSLNDEWFNRGFYGTLSHNSKAVYDKYMGWYDGNPVTLNPHIPTERAKRYIAALGGVDETLNKAMTAYEHGDYRWSSELANHVVFAEAENQQARYLLANSYEQLAYQAESAAWRNIYLTAAMELRQGGPVKYTGGSEDYLLPATETSDILNLLAVRLLPDKAEGKRFAFHVRLTDREETHLIWLENSVLHHLEDGNAEGAATIITDIRGLMAVALGYMTVDMAKAANMMDWEGDPKSLNELAAMLDRPTLDFNIIEP